jgi:hypothetical protein
MIRPQDRMLKHMFNQEEEKLTDGLMIAKRNKEAIPHHDKYCCQNDSAMPTKGRHYMEP